MKRSLFAGRLDRAAFERVLDCGEFPWKRPNSDDEELSDKMQSAVVDAWGESMRAAFLHVDADRDGFVDRAELEVRACARARVCMCLCSCSSRGCCSCDCVRWVPRDKRSGSMLLLLLLLLLRCQMYCGGGARHLAFVVRLSSPSTHAHARTHVCIAGAA